MRSFLRNTINGLIFIALASMNTLWSQPVAWEWTGPSRFPVFEGNGPCPNGMGLVSALYTDPLNPLLIFAGSNTGGLFRSRDGGLSWFNVTDASLPMVTGIGSIVRDPLHPERYYLGTGSSSYNREYGLGVWYSEDGGDSWRPTGLRFRPEEKDGIRASVKKLLIHPADPSVLYALVKDATAASVYRTQDQGKTWKRILKEEGEFFFDAEFAPGRPEVIYVGGRTLWISRDAGDNWIRTDMGSPGNEPIHRIAVSVHTDYPNVIWTLYETSGKRGIVLDRSDDGGHSWKNLAYHSAGQLSVGQWKMEFSVSTRDTSVFYAGGVYMHRSLNNGKTFSTISSTRLGTPQWMHVDVRSMLVFPSTNADIIYSGHDGGVSRSVDNGDTWQDISGIGLGITQFWGIGYDSQKQRVFGGTQDLGLLMYDDGIWKNMGIYGDAYDGVSCSGKGDTMLVFVNSGSPGMRRTTDGGKVWRYVNLPHGGGRSDLPIDYAASRPEEVIIGMHDLRRSRDFGETWTRMSDFTADFGVPAWENLVAVALSPSDPNVIYAGYGEPAWTNEARNRVFSTRNGGVSWQDITAGLEGVRWANLTEIIVHPDDPDVIWASVGGFWGDDDGSVYKVFHSEDGGESWENVSSGLPNLPVNCLLLLPQKRLLLAGTDAGVWAMPARGGSWTEWNNGLPRAIVSDMEYDPKLAMVFAATFGRGLYTLNLPVDKEKPRKEKRRRFLGIF